MGLQIGGCNEYEWTLFFFTLPFSIISGNISDTISFALLFALTLALSLTLAGSLLFSLEHSFIFSRSHAHSLTFSLTLLSSLFSVVVNHQLWPISENKWRWYSHVNILCDTDIQCRFNTYHWMILLSTANTSFLSKSTPNWQAIVVVCWQRFCMHWAGVAVVY